MDNNTTIASNATVGDASDNIGVNSTTGVIIIMVFTLLAVACIVCNSLVCYIILTRKTTDGSLKYYVFSLAITDVLVGAVCIPLFLSKEFILNGDSDLIESFSIVSDLFLCTCSIAHLCVMALDRVLSVKLPILHRTKFRLKRTALIMLIIPWAIGFIAAVAVGAQNSKDGEYIVSRMVVLLIPIPCMFIVVCYAILFCTVRKRNAKSIRNRFYYIKQHHMTKALFYVIAVFFVCWIPYLVSHSLTEKTWEEMDSKSSNALHYSTKFLSYSNSICNCIIYAIANPLFNEGLKDVLYGLFKRQKSNQIVEPQLQAATINKDFMKQESSV